MIRQKKPVIVMEYGTHSKYISTIIPLLKKCGPDKKFFLRQRVSFGNSRTVLFCV